MGHFQFVTICLLIFFVICVLHRLINKPDPDIGVHGIDISFGSFVLIFVLFVTIEALFSILVAGALSKLTPLQGAKAENLAGIINFISKFAIMLLVVRFFSIKSIFGKNPNNKRLLSKLIGSSIYNFGITFPVVIFFSFVWLSCLVFANSKGIKVDFSQQTIIALLNGIDNFWVLLCFIFAAVCIVPVIEEIMFRGFMYRAIKAQSSRLAANVVTAFVFAYLHSNVLAFVPLFVLSICLTKIYEKSADIREPILVHALFNLMNIFAILAGMSAHGAFY